MQERFSRVGGVLSYFARHRTAANLLLVVLVVAGFTSFPQMRAQFFPDVIIDNVRVNVAWDGAGAEDVDRGIVQPLEQALLAVEGVESSESTSREGSAGIVLDFEPGWDMARAADDVAAAVDAVTDLPDDAEDPVVRRGAWRDRVTDVVITGPVSADQLGRFADEFVTRLFVAGVTRTTIRGLAAPETVIEVPSLALVRHDISMAEIAEAIAAEAEADPAGDVTGANARVRTGVAKRSADQIAGVVLRSNEDGSKLTVADIATVLVGGADRERAYFVGENPAISVRVDRSDRGDAIDIQGQVEEVAAELQSTLPEGTTVELIRTRAEAITGRLNILLDNGLLGLGLVVALLFLFLNARTAFWVAAGIPVAMIGALAFMFLAGLTINMVSLFALIITLGIVVDDAIVVGEHADARYRKYGETPMQAAENAAQRMFPPVFSATITTIIAFFGLVAIGGRFGDLIADIPFTVIVVLIASLIECFLILPNHMAHSLKHSIKEHWYDVPSRVVNAGFRWFRETLFRPFIAWVIWARYPTVAAAVLVLALQMAPFLTGDLQWRFINFPERGSVSGNFAMAPAATREDTLVMMREMQRATEAVAKRYADENDGVDIVDYVMTEVGGNTGRGLSGVENKETYQLGSIAIELIDADLRRGYSSFAFVADVQDEVRRTPLVETVSFRGWRAGPGGDAIDVQLFGAEAEVLKAAAEDLKTQLAQFPEVSALEDSLSYDKQELILELTPQGQALGFTIDGLGRVLRHRLNGIEAASYPDGPRSATIRVEIPPGELTADFLDRTRMRTGTGDYVALADIVSVQSKAGFSTVRRENGLRLVSVTGDISEDDPARAALVAQTLETQILPDLEERFGVASVMSGLSEQEDRFLSEALTGFLLCLLGIYLVLAWIFSSWTRPVVVMMIIPFGLIGAFYGHMQHGVPLSMFSVVGLIGMTGIIINDSIVLVTTVDDHARDRGLVPAIVDGVCDRLRAVLLTTLTTVLGLAPLLFEQSQQAQFLKPTVITLVYGLGFGMLLVLLIVPAVMAMQQDFGRQLTALRRGLTAERRVLLPLSVATLGVAILFATTLGALIANGTIAAIWAAVLPAGAAMGSASTALLLFGASAILWVGLAFVVSAALLPRFARTP
ncbi:RND multidrug efflux transporter [Candidatus Rhodobacter oscarellae]|uniref:RND multidrug efflux transporter n=1 Tax=Candidatus Rhodobacter oscarellae TaxID=1675527 RepID=A0A0J9E938_9RHOB|nr:efflux RND transporter permease subunit [Candidatus Rhodobacter lobularis]KMW58179.1 RND multidrug efflux transporter [Candidatus Rhodobacter lobularis]